MNWLIFKVRVRAMNFALMKLDLNLTLDKEYINKQKIKQVEVPFLIR